LPHSRHTAEDETATTARVDGLIAARDRADTIARAVSSALERDGVRSVIVERLLSCLGQAAATNAAIIISTAPWLAILDADDFFSQGGSACCFDGQMDTTLSRTI
jgi:glycosyltransferase involved in cell wall biosynthesis